MDHNTPRSAPLFRAEAGVTLVGGGSLGAGDLKLSQRFAPHIVAVDGGADAVLAAGLLPEAVYGDLDSLSPASAAELPAGSVHHVVEQDSTDFDKALRHLVTPFCIAIGFTGARVDHELAVYHVLVARSEAQVIVLSSDDCIVHLSRDLDLTLPIGTRVSLFPMAPVTARSKGLRWPIDGLSFAPDTKIGTSNMSVEEIVSLRPDGPGMLLILPRDALPALLEAMGHL